MLYLTIFILPTSWKIKFHGDRPSQNSILTNLDPKSSIFYVFHIFFAILAMTGALLAWRIGWGIARAYSHSIPHVLAL